ncbi:K02A2.6-like [Cordylochernes scorpioides]|uniref:RNA-directed DNA polymerase n=1 Tax=Cordylochernes scorpioides TaxID=51811 RepID=A0ABY6LL69_9ARAC|nr:K02A2.6-like [Cordylochernes scorpioides]
MDPNMPSTSGIDLFNVPEADEEFEDYFLVDSWSELDDSIEDPQFTLEGLESDATEIYYEESEEEQIRQPTPEDEGWTELLALKWRGTRDVFMIARDSSMIYYLKSLLKRTSGAAGKEPGRPSIPSPTGGPKLQRDEIQKTISRENSENRENANPPAGVKDVNLAAARDVTLSLPASTSFNGAARVLGNWADCIEDLGPEADDAFTVVKGKKRRRESTNSPTAAAPSSNIGGARTSRRPQSSAGSVPRAQEIRTTRAHISEARARQASSSEEHCVYLEHGPELQPFHYLRALDRMLGGTAGVIQVSKVNGHQLLGLANRGLAERLINEGLEVEGTLLRAFPFRKRAERIAVGNLPFFVEDSAIIKALGPYGRITSIAPKMMKAGPYTYTDGRREAFIVLHEGVTTERLPTRLNITIKGEAWPAYLSSGIKSAPPASPAALPPTTTPAPPQRPTPQHSAPAPPLEISGASPRAAIHPAGAPQPSPTAPSASPTEETPPAPPPVIPDPSSQAPRDPASQEILGPANIAQDIEMTAVEESIPPSASSNKKCTRIDLAAFIKRNPSVSFAGTDALGLGREEVLDLLSSRTKAHKRGRHLTPPQSNALAGLVNQILNLRPGGDSNSTIYKVLRQVLSELRTGTAAVPPATTLPAPRPAEPAPPAPQKRESTPAMATPPPPPSAQMEYPSAMMRERYILPTAETIFSELKGATVFSVFDASSAFWQVPLDKESTNLCTIATPFGRFRFKRLPYGLNSASEVFQRCINNILSGLQGTACYMDDILIYGSTMEEHNRNLETVLRRLEENNVKLIAKKQQIAVDKVNFLGHIISRDGIAIQASRAEAIQKLKRPENKTEVQRFLGMVTYLGKFIPNLSDKTAPLRKLISNKSEWKFGGEENDCFEKLKDMVSNAPILTFFDPTKPITISSDASQYGIGTVLMQGGHAIEYASFSLNATQRKYAQIEKEPLAIVFGCERFQYYIWGNDVIVETDHKPLLSIVKKPLEKLSPRLQRMVLRLMRFQISLKFTPGKNMFVADHLSRDPLNDEVDTSYLEGQTESVHMLLVTTDEKIKRLQKETHGDHTLIQLIEYAKNGWPKYKTKVCDEAKPYWQFQDEIHVSDGIVYKGNCIMVPSTLRKEILQVVHSSHQGIAASKEKARSAFYWPGMITQVENEVEKCRTCQEYSRKNPEESRIAHEIPEFPWEKIAVDFMEVSGTSSILVVDYHSKFVEIRKLSSKRETETIMQLKTIFRTHGIPRTLVSDNGPPFNSTGFKNFAQKYEFKHQTSSPKYPRSNGQVERTIQTIKGLIIKAVKSGRDPNLALMEFNNTPKYDLPSPTQMLMGRSVRTLSTYTRQQLKPLFDTTKNYQKLRDHQQKYAESPKRILRPLEV